MYRTCTLYMFGTGGGVFAFVSFGCCYLLHDFNRGIKHDFPFINIRKVPREMLKAEGEARGYEPSRVTLRMLMNDKIMFDGYYCINSAKHCENKKKKHWRTIFYNLITFSYGSMLLKTIHDLDPVQIIIFLHVLCVAPVTSIIKSRVLTARAQENSLVINTRLLCL